MVINSGVPIFRIFTVLYEYLPTGLVVHIVSVVICIFYRMGCVSCFCISDTYILGREPTHPSTGPGCFACYCSALVKL